MMETSARRFELAALLHLPMYLHPVQCNAVCNAMQCKGVFTSFPTAAPVECVKLLCSGAAFSAPCGFV
jgi:hypothetical protein